MKRMFYKKKERQYQTKKATVSVLTKVYTVEHVFL